MSWISNIEGKPDPNYKDDGPKVPDPAIPDRMVSTKRANQPFLSYKNYRDQQAKLHAAWREREDARLAAIARGDPDPPRAEPDPTAQKEIGLLGLFKFLAYLFVGVLLAGKFVTGEWGWGIDGDVFDVSSNRRVYGPGGSYALMAGVDAARAFGTGCFKDHRTHDLRGLSESELQGVAHWKKFFSEHKSYVKVGRVNHPPIDPASPLPVHCDPKKEVEQKAREAEGGDWG
ncbi:cytochrome b5 [Lactarius indigo]|nr:cytochrome b5 [Lactarius indigo]